MAVRTLPAWGGHRRQAQLNTSPSLINYMHVCCINALVQCLDLDGNLISFIDLHRIWGQ